MIWFSTIELHSPPSNVKVCDSRISAPLRRRGFVRHIWKYISENQPSLRRILQHKHSAHLTAKFKVVKF